MNLILSFYILLGGGLTLPGLYATTLEHDFPELTDDKLSSAEMCLDLPCHNDATCTAIGPDLFGCKCNGVLVGDGISSCEMPGTVKDLTDSEELELKRTLKKNNKKSRSPTPPPVICFPGHALVTVQRYDDDEHKMEHSQLEMRHVQVGDRVLGMNGKYTPVYAFGHQASHLTERYVRIFTNATTGSSASTTTPLELSDRHFLYLHKHQKFPVLPADLKKGDVLLGAAGEPLEIVKIEYNVKGRGVFAPLTADGTIVVNGVVTSNYAFVLLTHPDEPSDYIYWDNWLWRAAAGGNNRKFKFMTQHGFMHMTCSPLRIIALGISPWFGTLSNNEGMNYLSCAYLQAYTWWKQSPSGGTTKKTSLVSIVKSRLLSAFGFLAWYFMFGIAWISYAFECMVGPSVSPTVIGLVVMMAATFHIKNKQNQKRKRMTACGLKLKAT